MCPIGACLINRRILLANAEKEMPGEIARSYSVRRWTISRLMM
jgi:hypothetical protein